MKHSVVLTVFLISLVLNVTSRAEDPIWSEVTADQLFQDDIDPLFRSQTPQASDNAPAPSEGFDNGNDPTRIRRRFTFRNDYVSFANGLKVNTTSVQTVFPILQEETLTSNFGFEVPMNYYEVEQPIDATLSGVGDMKAQLMFIKPVNETMTMIFGSNLWLPTAEQQLLELPDSGSYTDVDLGTGKFRLEPLIGSVIFVNQNLFVIPFYAHDVSIAGKSEAGPVNRGSARLFVNYSFDGGYYASSETQMLINYANDNDIDAFQRLELGRAFRNGTVFYVKPGIGIAPDEFNREWGLECGLRFVF
ncbi:MAG: hypothetical protein ACK58L_02735 [Planctomycetota bacterium]